MKRPHDYSSPHSDTDELIDVGQEDSYCPVTGSMSPGSASQILARKKRRGIIEKRRRDRINHSLSELRRLVPSAFEKQGSSKLEKAEILQMTVDHLKLLHAMGGKVYLDARALAVDYRMLGFRECLGEVVRYLSSLEGVASSDPIGARLVSHLSHCASELDPLLQSPAALSFPPWPWPSLPPASSAPFPPTSHQDLAPHSTGTLLGYPSLSNQGAILSPALTSVRRSPSIPSHPHRLQQHLPNGPTIPSPLQSVTPPSSSCSTSSFSTGPSQVSFRPFAPLGSPVSSRRGLGNSSKPAKAWGTEIGAF
ncbi:hairy/enhancer-of-split related with YRPW motif-like protein [Xyrauchen texanus]|uniref:hairy/enhancer-of-split related with YRPW motif-like protein n=1 Tax=Xyrauchen texanus TaxID=154827 RepID=UPI002241BFD1|nr:hairy/enhancer-of-split related with YRPW motif-like protein [Xyrauchen texanus]